jgi:hydroxypyruvate isomerase
MKKNEKDIEKVNLMITKTVGLKNSRHACMSKQKKKKKKKKKKKQFTVDLIMSIEKEKKRKNILMTMKSISIR